MSHSSHGARADEWPIRSSTVVALALATFTCAVLLSGCVGQGPPGAAPTIAPGPGPDSSPGRPISGHVYIEGVPVEDARVEAVSADGALNVHNTTTGSGAYVLFLPPGDGLRGGDGLIGGRTQLNLTATYGWMHHTVWPAFAGGRYDVHLNTTPKSLIAGGGRVVGGPLGYNTSLYNFSAVTIQAVPADGNATAPVASTTANGDGSYSLEVRPGVRYVLKGGLLANMWFNYHETERGGSSIELRLDPDETALIDYTVVLPSTLSQSS